jgi:hypothetical protein
LLRKIGKISLLFFSFLLLLAATSYILLRSRPVQGWLAGKITTYLSDELHTRVTVGGVDVEFFKSLVLEDLYVEDLHQDTLLFTKRLSIDIKSFDNAKRLIEINSATLDRADINFIYHPNDSDYNYDFLIDYFDPPRTTPRIGPKKIWVIQIDKLNIQGSSYSMSDLRKTYDAGEFDENYMQYDSVEGKIENFRVIDDSITADIKHLSGVEKSGLKISHLEAGFTISSTLLELKNLQLVTPHSHIQHYFSLHYKIYDDLNDFENMVDMRANLDESEISLKDLAYFDENIRGFEQKAMVKGNVSGKLKNLKVKGMHVAFGQESFIAGSLNMKGLPDMDETFMEIKIDNALTNKQDLGYIFTEVELPVNITRMGDIRFSGKFTGFLYDFVANGVFNTRLGTIHSDLNMKIGRGEESTSYSGLLALKEFDAGTILQQPSIGKVTLSSEIQGKGLSISTAYAKMKGHIDRLEANSYTYSNIAMDGEISKRLFKGKAAIADPNLNFDFAGTINFSSSKPEFDFDATINKANLKALNISGDSLILSTVMAIHFKGSSVEDINGELNISDTRLQKGDKLMDIKSINVNSLALENGSILHLTSDIADVKLSGRYNFADLQVSFNNYMAHLLPNYFTEKTEATGRQDFTFDINLKNTDMLSELFIPGIRVQRGMVNGSFNSTLPRLEFNGKAAELNVENNIFREVTFSAINRTGSYDLDISASVQSLLVSDTILLTDLVAAVDLSTNHISSFIKTGDTSTTYHAMLNNEVVFSAGNKIEIQFTESMLKFKQFSWQPDSSGRVLIEDDKLRFDRFNLRKGEQRISLNGTISNDYRDYVIVNFNKLRIDFINLFAQPMGKNIDGLVSGDLIISKLLTEPIFAATILVNDLALDKDTLGNFTANTDYNISSDLMQVNIKSSKGLFRDLSVLGTINMKNDDKSLNLNVSLQPTDISFIEPSVNEFVSRISGLASCRLKVTGTLSEPEVNGKINLQDAAFTVNYLRTSYSFSNTFNLEKNVIHLNKFTIRDSAWTIKDSSSHTALVSGSVYHKNFDNFYLKVNVDQMNNLVCLNTDYYDNSLFYGKGIASGSASFIGDLNDVAIKIDAVSEKNTAIYIPLNNEDNVSQSSYVKFVGPDSKTPYKADFDGFTLEFNLELTSEAEIQLIFDSQLGDIIKGRGNGDLKLEVDRAGDFRMYGDYIIEEGDYLFTAMNVWNKPFVIKKGSRLVWDGDPLQARMQIEAVYELTASPYNLVYQKVHDAHNYQLAVPVECVMHLSGLMMSPDIRFGIRFPDQNALGSGNSAALNNIVKQLETTPDEMSRQVFSLLLFQRFLESGTQAQVLNHGVSTSAGELLANQLSNWLSQALPGLQVGINISGQDTFNSRQVLIQGSYKIFQDRLVIDGYIDAANNQTNSVSIQYVLTKNGRLRIKVYNKFVAPSPINPIQTSNTQGIGLFYRKEFERFFKKKKKPAPVTQPVSKTAAPGT